MPVNSISNKWLIRFYRVGRCLAYLLTRNGHHARKNVIQSTLSDARERLISRERRLIIVTILESFSNAGKRLSRSTLSTLRISTTLTKPGSVLEWEDTKKSFLAILKLNRTWKARQIAISLRLWRQLVWMASPLARW